MSENSGVRLHRFHCTIAKIGFHRMFPELIPIVVASGIVTCGSAQFNPSHRPVRKFLRILTPSLSLDISNQELPSLQLPQLRYLCLRVQHMYKLRIMAMLRTIVVFFSNIFFIRIYIYQTLTLAVLYFIYHILKCYSNVLLLWIYVLNCGTKLIKSIYMIYK